MKSYNLFACLAAAALLQTTALAQDNSYDITAFQATCRTLNGSGRLTTTVLTGRDVRRHCATSVSETNIDHLKLVYVPGGDQNGDLIQVVNKTNNAVVCTPFRLLFQKQVAGAGGVTVERLAFIFTRVEGSDPVGSATITETHTGSGRILLSGRMQFYDESFFPDAHAIITGSFKARSK